MKVWISLDLGKLLEKTKNFSHRESRLLLVEAGQVMV
jgi:hypothetical protein